MNDPIDKLGERLRHQDESRYAAEAVPPEAIASLFDRQLTRTSTLKYLVMGGGGLVACLVCGELALNEPVGLARGVRGLLALFAVIGLGWASLATLVLARGGGGFVLQRTASARMAFASTLITLIALALVALVNGRGVEATPLLTTGLGLLVLAAVLLIDTRVEQAELTVREQILRLEKRLSAQWPVARSQPDPAGTWNVGSAGSEGEERGEPGPRFGH